MLHKRQRRVITRYTISSDHQPYALTTVRGVGFWDCVATKFEWKMEIRLVRTIIFLCRKANTLTELQRVRWARRFELWTIE